MSRPQYAVRCVAGKHKGKWRGCRSGFGNGPWPWSRAYVYWTKATAQAVCRIMAPQYGGKWRVVPVPEPEVEA